VAENTILCSGGSSNGRSSLEVVTVAPSTTTDAIASGDAVANALTDGFQAAFIGAAAIALVEVLVSLVVVRREDVVESPVDATPALEAALSGHRWGDRAQGGPDRSTIAA
jgi:hypothetical protein